MSETEEDLVVADACTLLDEVCTFNWRPHINLKALDVEDVFRCPLAQIGHHGEGIAYEHAYAEMSMRIFRDLPGTRRERLAPCFYSNQYLEAWKRALAA